MDRTSKKLIDFMQRNEPNMPDHLFTMDYLARSCGLNIEDTKCAIKYLEEQKYIVICWRGYSTDAAANMGCELAHKGRHYKEFSRIERNEFLVKSILIPVLISLVVSAITTWIGWMWGSRIF